MSTEPQSLISVGNSDLSCLDDPHVCMSCMSSSTTVAFLVLNRKFANAWGVSKDTLPLRCDDSRRKPLPLQICWMSSDLLCWTNFSCWILVHYRRVCSPSIRCECRDNIRSICLFRHHGWGAEVYLREAWCDSFCFSGDKEKNIHLPGRCEDTSWKFRLNMPWIWGVTHSLSEAYHLQSLFISHVEALNRSHIFTDPAIQSWRSEDQWHMWGLPWARQSRSLVFERQMLWRLRKASVKVWTCPSVSNDPVIFVVSTAFFFLLS